MHLKPPPTLVSGEVARRQSGVTEGAACESAHSSRNKNLLPGGEGGAPLRDAGGIPVRQAVDKPRGVDLPGGLADGVIRNGFVPQADVGGDIPGEQEYILLHLADRARHIMRASGNRLQWTGGYPTREILARDVELGFSRLMLHQGQPAASFAFIPGPDPTYDYIEDGHWLDERQPYHVIHRIASSGEHKGVIAAMMAFAARHGHNVRIDTHADNAIMQHLLARHGFTRCGVIYLANGEPRLAYQKTDN